MIDIIDTKNTLNILAKDHRLLLTINGNPISIWQGFKELCEAYDLPYHTLKQKPFPRHWKEYDILKLPFRSKQHYK